MPDQPPPNIASALDNTDKFLFGAGLFLILVLAVLVIQMRERMDDKRFGHHHQRNDQRPPVGAGRPKPKAPKGQAPSDVSNAPNPLQATRQIPLWSPGGNGFGQPRTSTTTPPPQSPSLASVREPEPEAAPASASVRRTDPFKPVLDAWRAAWSAQDSPRDMLERFDRLPEVTRVSRLAGTEVISVTLETGETFGMPASRFFDVVAEFYRASTPASPISEVEDVVTPARLSPSGTLQEEGELRIS
jgi:hypothetical protein